MTLIERFKLDHPDNAGYSEGDVEACLIKCPRYYGYTNDDYKFCKEMNYDRSKYSSICIACWNREIPETPKAEPELKYEANFEEEKKMKVTVFEALRDRVRECINKSDIEDAVVEAVGSYDLDYYIEQAMDDVIGNLDDQIGTAAREIAGEMISEIVSDILDV